MIRAAPEFGTEHVLRRNFISALPVQATLGGLPQPHERFALCRFFVLQHRCVGSLRFASIRVVTRMLPAYT